MSNDELRDHIWALLRPKHFLRWTVRHIARYRLPPGVGGGGGVRLSPPGAFTPCVQQLEGGAWAAPAAGRREWLLVRPRP